jgi:hypothetical protein
MILNINNGVKKSETLRFRPFYHSGYKKKYPRNKLSSKNRRNNSSMFERVFPNKV